MAGGHGELGGSTTKSTKSNSKTTSGHTKMVIPLAALLPEMFGTLIVIYFLLSKGGKIAA